MNPGLSHLSPTISTESTSPFASSGICHIAASPGPLYIARSFHSMRAQTWHNLVALVMTQAASLNCFLAWPGPFAGQAQVPMSSKRDNSEKL